MRFYKLSSASYSYQSRGSLEENVYAEELLIPWAQDVKSMNDVDGNPDTVKGALEVLDNANEHLELMTEEEVARI